MRRKGDMTEKEAWTIIANATIATNDRGVAWMEIQLEGQLVQSIGLCTLIDYVSPTRDFASRMRQRIRERPPEFWATPDGKPVPLSGGYYWDFTRASCESRVKFAAWAASQS